MAERGRRLRIPLGNRLARAAAVAWMVAAPALLIDSTLVQRSIAIMLAGIGAVVVLRPRISSRTLPEPAPETILLPTLVVHTFALATIFAEGPLRAEIVDPLLATGQALAEHPWSPTAIWRLMDRDQPDDMLYSASLLAAAVPLLLGAFFGLSLMASGWPWVRRYPWVLVSLGSIDQPNLKLANLLLRFRFLGALLGCVVIPAMPISTASNIGVIPLHETMHDPVFFTWAMTLKALAMSLCVVGVFVMLKLKAVDRWALRQRPEDLLELMQGLRR